MHATPHAVAWCPQRARAWAGPWLHAGGGETTASGKGRPPSVFCWSDRFALPCIVFSVSTARLGAGELARWVGQRPVGSPGVFAATAASSTCLHRMRSIQGGLLVPSALPPQRPPPPLPPPLCVHYTLLKPFLAFPPAVAASSEGNQIFVVVRKGKEYPPKVCDCR